MGTVKERYLSRLPNGEIIVYRYRSRADARIEDILKKYGRA